MEIEMEKESEVVRGVGGCSEPGGVIQTEHMSPFTQFGGCEGLSSMPIGIQRSSTREKVKIAKRHMLILAMVNTRAAAQLAMRMVLECSDMHAGRGTCALCAIASSRGEY